MAKFKVGDVVTINQAIGDPIIGILNGAYTRKDGSKTRLNQEEINTDKFSYSVFVWVEYYPHPDYIGLRVENGFPVHWLRQATDNEKALFMRRVMEDG